MGDLISRRDAINALDTIESEVADGEGFRYAKWREYFENLPSSQTDSFVDADKLKRCRFEYINACKIVARPTPDTSKNDIYDAHAVIKALYPIFGDEEF